MRLGVLDVGSNTVHLLVVDAHRRAAGALVAEAAMRALRVSQLEICPWALREGVILRRLDTLDGTAQIDRSAQDASERLGRLTTFEARCTG